jgi:death-on-curing family protein
MVAEQFQLMKKITPVSSHHHELHEGSYKAVIYSLVCKWELKKTGLLEAWAELGCRLTRSHCFTNGNKRTALLTMITFIHACGFRLKDDKNNKILLMK